ncbi:MAG: hypothetical protein U0326_15590 [Polyangiales bacterium]
MGHFPTFWRALVQVWKHTELFSAVTLDAGYTSQANAALIDGDGYGYDARQRLQLTLRAELSGRCARGSVSPTRSRTGSAATAGACSGGCCAPTRSRAGEGWAHVRQGWLVQTVTLDDVAAVSR